MDPWADSAASWSPEGAIEATSSGPAQSPYRGGPVDPWAEPSSSSSTIPVITSQKDEFLAARGLPEQHIAEPESGGDFDPWGGNTAPIAPLSSAYSERGHDADDDDRNRIEESNATNYSEPSAETSELPSLPTGEESSSITTRIGTGGEEQNPIPDDDDPWGSGAAARRIKAQHEAEMAAQRMEILQLQEEAKGKEFDLEGKEVLNVAKDDGNAAGEKQAEVEDPAASSAPTATNNTGWRSIFNRGAAKSGAPEKDDKKDVPKIDTDVTSKNSASPVSSSTAAAPRLWQAPSLLGGHNRASSTTSRSSITNDSGSTVSSANQGPGWEVTTKKQQPTGGGLIQSLFGNPSRTSGEVDRTAATNTPKDERRTGLNRFGRGFQAPPVVSAADEEEEAYETEETGIEWEASGAFDDAPVQKARTDFLSDDAVPSQTESTVGRLLGKWRGGNAQSKAKPEAVSKDDLSWLDEVAQSTTQSSGSHKAANDDDWMAFLNQQPATKDATLNASAKNQFQSHQLDLHRSNSERHRISSTAKGTLSAPAPPLAPPPTQSKVKALLAPSPFTFRGPGQGVAKGLKESRLLSGSSTQEADNSNNFDEFEQFSSSNLSPNPDDAYRDEVTENNASLLKTRLRPEQTQRNNSFLRGLQSKARRTQYDYDEEEDTESRDDSWSAFRDEPHQKSYDSPPYRDVPQHTTVRTHQQPSRPLPSSSISVTSSHSERSRTSPSSHGLAASYSLPPAPLLQRPQSTPNTGHLPPPPGISHSTPATITPTPSSGPPALQSSMPKKLSQGKILTNDDLSFFESL
ncbi:hypothetical protein CBS101457_006304 [Exobasidium rhododendri]|nr:hypothetical protein CBS101457_006304 [Exobasidium rhododendri]